MAEETQAAPQPRRVEDHAGAAANPEQHLAEAHKLSIRVQGKEGQWGRAVWALIREDRGKVKTMAVFEGTRREAANHFFDFIHPNKAAASAAPGQRAASGYRQGPRQGPRGGRPQGGPQRRP